MSKVEAFLNKSVVCLLLVGEALLAQGRTGSVSGRLTSADERPVPNASVTIENLDTGLRMTSTTDASGTYRFERVPFGRYKVSSTATTATSGTEVAVNSEAGVQVRARSADVPSTAATAPAVEATSLASEIDSSQISKAFSTRRIDTLPQPNVVERDGSAYGAYNLSLLPAGVVAAGSSVVISGQSPSSNNFHVDGIDNNNHAVPGPLVYVSNEATAEFSLFQNRKAGSDFGHATGGQFNSIVRTGTNQVHGAIYDYLQNRHMNAMNRQYGALGLQNNPRYDQNRVGGSVGMPVLPNRVFFYGNFEFIPLGFEGAAGDLVTFAPTTAGYAALGGIPGVSRTNLGVLSRYLGPATQSDRTLSVNGRAIPFGPVLSSSRNWQNQYIGTGALDWTSGQTDSLHLRYAHNERDANFSGASLSSFQTPVHSRSQLATISHYHSFFSVLTNELRAGYTRWDTARANGNFQFPGLGAFPSISIPADVNIALGPAVGLLSNGVVNTFHLADNVAVTWRGHNLRFGFDGRRIMSSLNGFPSASGIYGYSSLGQFLQDLPPDIQSQSTFNGGAWNGNQWSLFGFVNDRFNAARGVTIDVGLGYQYLTVPSSIQRQALNDVASVPGVLEFTEPQSQNWNWTPKVGIGVSPGRLPRTTFRAGFGMERDALWNNYAYAPTAPQLGTTVYGDLGSTTPGFLSRGGLANPNPAGGNLTAAQARALTTSYYADQRLPYTMQWNAGVQQELFHGIVIEAKYLGARTLDIPVQARINSVARVTQTFSLPLYYGFPAVDLNGLPVTYSQIRIGQANSLAGYGFSSPITTFVNDGQSTYHGLALEARSRFSGGFQMLGSYTWSHLIDNVAYGTIQDTGNRAGDRADSVLDRRQRAVVTAFWEPAALFSNTGSIVRNVVANVSLGGTFTYQSPGFGTPLSGFDSNLDGNGLSDRAIYNPTGTGTSTATALTNRSGQVVGYLADDPTARYVRSPLGSFVQAPRNTLRLGQINNFDVFAVKGFSYRDRFSVQVRGEAFNLFNHAQYTGDPVRTLMNPSSSAMTSMLIAGTSNFGNLNFIGSRPRLLQVALRVTF